MAENSKIEWTDHTFNPWVGCTKVSPACDGCYAEAWAKRTGNAKLWQGERRRTSEANWKQPAKWNAAAQAAGKRARVFCCSLADVFDNQVPPEWRGDLFELIRATPHLEWQLLTKRPQNIVKMCEAAGGLPANAALGTTVENAEELDRRTPHLVAAKKRLRPLYIFLSIEPLLGPISLRWAKWDTWRDDDGRQRPTIDHLDGLRMIDGIIVGGESGAHARPLHPKWVRAIRDECAEAGVSFFFKQWGEWLPGENYMLQRPVEPATWQDGEVGKHSSAERKYRWQHYEPTGPGTPGAFGLRVGKKAAGRLLDGREWNDMPRVA